MYLPILYIALERALTTCRNQAFRNAPIPVYGFNFPGYLDPVKNVVEGYGVTGYTLADPGERRFEFPFVADQKAQVREYRLDRLEPERIVQAAPPQRFRIERIDLLKRRDRFWNDLLLLQATPVFMFAHQHRFKAWSPEALLLLEDWKQGADGKIPVADDRIDSPGIVGEEPRRLLEKLAHRETYSALDVFV